MNELELLKKRLLEERKIRKEGDKILFEQSNELFWVKQNLEEMAHLINFIPFPVLRFDDGGSLIFSNPAARRVWGRSAMPGATLKSVFDFTEHMDLKGIINQDQIIELHGKKRDAYFRFIFKGISRYKVGYLYALDVSEYEQEKQELLQSRDESNALLDNISSVLIGIDHEGRVMHWNKFAEKLFGLNEHDVLGQSLEAIPVGWDSASIFSLIDTCRHQTTLCEDTIGFSRQDGKAGLLDVVLAPVTRKSQKKGGVFLLIREITKPRSSDLTVAAVEDTRKAVELMTNVVEELSTPLRSIGENVLFLDEAINQVRSLVEKHIERLSQDQDDQTIEQFVSELGETMQFSSVDRVLAEIPSTLEATSHILKHMAHVLERTEGTREFEGEEQEPTSLALQR